jgi:small GTP-binding protein
LSYPDTNVFLVCFSVVNPNSYDNVTSKWVPELRLHCAEAPIILVGTKIDLRNDEEVIKKLSIKDQQPKTKEDGEKLKEEIGAASYTECSAKSQDGLKEVFQKAIEATNPVKHTKKDDGKKKKGGCVLL